MIGLLLRIGTIFQSAATNETFTTELRRWNDYTYKNTVAILDVREGCRFEGCLVYIKMSKSVPVNKCPNTKFSRCARCFYSTGITLRYDLRDVHLRRTDDRTSCFTYRQTDAVYRTFLLSVLPVRFEDVPLQRQHTWLIHDAAWTHFLHIVRQHLNQSSGGRG